MRRYLWAGAGSVLVASILATTVILLVERQRGYSEKLPQGDLQEYTAALKTRVPFDVKKFTESGMKAESYVKDEQYGHFKELTIAVEPINLTDKITGKTARYTKAKLTRNDIAPTAAGKVGNLRNYSRNAYESAHNTQFEWAKVEMLP